MAAGFLTGSGFVGRVKTVIPGKGCRSSGFNSGMAKYIRSRTLNHACFC